MSLTHVANDCIAERLHFHNLLERILFSLQGQEMQTRPFEPIGQATPAFISEDMISSFSLLLSRIA